MPRHLCATHNIWLASVDDCGWTVAIKAAILRTLQNALVAQLDRVLVSEAKGRGFDSRRAHQSCMNVGT